MSPSAEGGYVSCKQLQTAVLYGGRIKMIPATRASSHSQSDRAPPATESTSAPHGRVDFEGMRARRAHSK